MKLGMISKPEAASFDHAKKLGLEFVEFDCNDPTSMFGLEGGVQGNPAVDAYALRALAPVFSEAIERTGITIGALGRWGSHVYDEHGKIKQEEFGHVTQLLDLCADLNIPVYCVSATSNPALSLYQNITAVIDYFKRVVDYASKAGTTVAVVNCSMGGNFVRRPEMWDIVLPEVPGLKIKYDPSHSFIHGGPDGAYKEETLAYGDRFGYVHIKGVLRGKGGGMNGGLFEFMQLGGKAAEIAREKMSEGMRLSDSPPAGFDMIDWPFFMAALYKNGYDGMLSLEPYSRTWSGDLADKGIKFSADYIRQFIL